MNYLVDTYIFLWWLDGNKQLKKLAQKILKDSHNHIFVSVASLWEISIKHAIGKLSLKTTLPEMVSLSGFEVLPIQFTHVIQLETLKFHHRDPFDRIIIAQAQVEKFTFITDDTKIKKYDVKVI